jgi:hypothetical protein
MYRVKFPVYWGFFFIFFLYKLVSLFPGGGNLTVKEGQIVGGVCTGLTPLNTSVSLDLEV